MSPLWDQTLPGRAPVAPTEKSLCTFAFVWSRSPSALPTSSPNSAAGWIPPCHLMMCCQDNARLFLCLKPAFLHWDVSFGAFQLLCHEKIVKLFLSLFPCYLWSVLHPIGLPPLPRRVHLTCHCTGAAPCLVTGFCCPSPDLSLFHHFVRDGTLKLRACGADAVCQECRQQLGTIFQLSPYSYSSFCRIFNCSWAH